MNKHTLYAALRRPWRRSAEQRTRAWVEAESAAFDRDAMSLAAHGESALVLTLSNAGYMEFARNWYAFFKPLDRKNYLAVALDDGALAVMSELGIQHARCSFGRVLDESFSAYGEVSFNRITAYKILYVYLLLRMGLDVLLTDGDIVWLADPLPALADSADLQIQIDNEGEMHISQAVLQAPKVCTGFFYARSNPRTIALFYEVLVLLEQLPRFNDQHCVNLALLRGRKAHEVVFLEPNAQVGATETEPGSLLSVRLLDPARFVNGSVYFRDQERFLREGGDPLIVHANWIHGRERKIREMKEHGLWRES